jgi:SpoVK/Ycf46/Vps4 family AAA+-type ATPase
VFYVLGKYPGKPGLKMLMHLIQKVGQACAPTVIKIDNCEKTYVKKVPKTDKTEPKRLKKQIGKMLKSFSPGDQMLLIGLTSEPWLCPFKV